MKIPAGDYSIFKTEVYEKWFHSLNDLRAQARIDKRIVRIKYGNFGDNRFVGYGVYELRIDYGPGYRIYYKRCDSLQPSQRQ